MGINYLILDYLVYVFVYPQYMYRVDSDMQFFVLFLF